MLTNSIMAVHGFPGRLAGPECPCFGQFIEVPCASKRAGIKARLGGGWGGRSEKGTKVGKEPEPC